MTKKKAVDIMTRLQAEYFYAFKDMPENLFSIKVKNFMEALDGYSDEEIDVALLILLKESETCPTAAGFVKVIERNRDLQQTTAREEWAKTYEVLIEMRNRSNKFNSALCDWDEHNAKQKETYSRLSKEVKEYYVDYSSFLDLIYANKFDIEKNCFLKQFPIFRQERKQKKILEELEKKYV